MKKHLLLLVYSGILLSCNTSPPAEFLIMNASVIDGLGNPAIEADIMIRNGLMEIVQAGEGGRALDTINAKGLTVAPGFLDVHNHSDEGMRDAKGRLNEGFSRQGVTTIVGGPDGYLSPREIKEYLADYNKNGIGNNVAFYVGHNGIRSEVMGENQNRPPNSEELARMKALVREGMEMGAVGLSTGLMYEPGLYSDTEEIISLAKEVAPFGGIYDSHVRNPVHEFVKSHREVIEISSKAGVPGKLGHLKGVGLQNDGVIAEIIKMVDSSRTNGFNIVSDQYPYDGAQTAILEEIIIFPSDMAESEILDSLWQNDKLDEVRNLINESLTDQSKRSRIKVVSEEGENGGFAWLNATGYSCMRVTNSEDFPELVGKYLSEIAEERNMDAFDLLCELIIEGNQSTSITLGGINEKDVQTLLVQPWNMVVSDGAYVEQSEASGGHPRSTGTFPKVLGHYVRDLQLLSLEEAVRKMTSLPADIIGFPERGRIQDGLPADIVIFNPLTIAANSTFEQPNLYASGVIHVFVNGIPVLRDEKMTGMAPGIYLDRKKE